LRGFEKNARGGGKKSAVREGIYLEKPNEEAKEKTFPLLEKKKPSISSKKTTLRKAAMMSGSG